MQLRPLAKSTFRNVSKYLRKVALPYVAAAVAFGLSACSPVDDSKKRAEEILSLMTLEEKVGQVIQGDISTVTPEDAKNYNLGSVLNGGNSARAAAKRRAGRIG